MNATQAYEMGVKLAMQDVGLVKEAIGKSRLLSYLTVGGATEEEAAKILNTPGGLQAANKEVLDGVHDVWRSGNADELKRIARTVQDQRDLYGRKPLISLEHTARPTESKIRKSIAELRQVSSFPDNVKRLNESLGLTGEMTPAQATEQRIASGYHHRPLRNLIRAEEQLAISEAAAREAEAARFINRFKSAIKAHPGKAALIGGAGLGALGLGAYGLHEALREPTWKERLGL